MFDIEKKREKELQNKEEIYEAVVKPLVKQLYDICKEQGIPFYAAFEIGNELRGTCRIPAEANVRLHAAYAVLSDEAMLIPVGQMPASTRIHD